jgi:NAD(P)-dependent dehydrogenase (short-subunit alcohol dehydrogenase family)
MTSQPESGTGPNAVGHHNILKAIITAVSDLFSREHQLPPIGPDERFEGKIALVTGANSGLGKAVAIQLAERGAHVLMACRGGHPEAGEEVKRASGSERVEMLRVDLSDLDRVQVLCDELRDRGQPIDVAVFNAGLMPVRARQSPQGFELMFAVHFLASRLMVERFLADGVLVPSSDPARRPRIVFVSSEAHKSSAAIDFDHFGEFFHYGLRDGMKEYGRSKLHICTYAIELARHLNPGDEVVIGVNALCPGPVASNIGREAPLWLKPIVPPLLKLLFRSPQKAAAPVLLLACGRAMEGRNGVYLHMLREKPVSAEASDPEKGRLLWEKSEALLAPYLPPRSS